MKALRSLAAIFAFGTTLAACGHSPTATDESRAIGSASRNVSAAPQPVGGANGPDPVLSGESSTTASAPAEPADSTGSGSVERGGYTYGSGN